MARFIDSSRLCREKITPNVATKELDAVSDANTFLKSSKQKKKRVQANWINSSAFSSYGLPFPASIVCFHVFGL